MSGGQYKRASWHAFSLLSPLKSRELLFTTAVQTPDLPLQTFYFYWLLVNRASIMNTQPYHSHALKVQITGLGLQLRHLTLAKGRATPDRGLRVKERIVTVTHTFTCVILVNLHTQGLFPGWVKAIPLFFLLSLLYFICTPKLWVVPLHPFMYVKTLLNTIFETIHLSLYYTHRYCSPYRKSIHKGRVERGGGQVAFWSC